MTLKDKQILISVYTIYLSFVKNDVYEEFDNQDRTSIT